MTNSRRSLFWCLSSYWRVLPVIHINTDIYLRLERQQKKRKKRKKLLLFFRLFTHYTLSTLRAMGGPWYLYTKRFAPQARQEQINFCINSFWCCILQSMYRYINFRCRRLYKEGWTKGWTNGWRVCGRSVLDAEIFLKFLKFLLLVK